MKRIITSIILAITCMTGSNLVVAETFSPPSNVKINPFGALFGIASGGVDIGITENLSIGAGGSYMKDAKRMLKSDSKIWGAEARVTHYKSGMCEDSFTTTLSLGKSGIDFKDEAPELDIRCLAATGLVGYRWISDSGLNASLAGGASRSVNKLKGEKSYGHQAVTPAFEMTVGWQI